MKGTWYKIMFQLIKKVFIWFLAGVVSASNHTKRVSLRNHKCMTQAILVNLHPNEHSWKFHNYPFAVKLDRCVASCNTLNDLSNKVCLPNKTEKKNIKRFYLWHFIQNYFYGLNTIEF